VASKDPRIVVTVSVPAAEYKASFGPAGFAPPSIPLALEVRNDSRGDWVCQKATFIVEAEVTTSGRRFTRDFPLSAGGCALKVGETLKELAEVGAFLTEAASSEMKGAALKVRAGVTLKAAAGHSAFSSWSEPVTLRVFVPEG
jgi:hypothetical protein